MECPKCKAELYADALFCTQCGEKLPQNILCGHCGTENPLEAVFCYNCGKKVQNDNDIEPAEGWQTESSKKRIVDNGNSNVTIPCVENVQEEIAQVSIDENLEEGHKKRKVSMAATIIAIITCVALIYGVSDLDVPFSYVSFEDEYINSNDNSRSKVEDEHINSNDNSRSKAELDILYKMAEIKEEQQKMLPYISSSYNVYRSDLAKGYLYSTSPAWRQLMDYKNKMEDLCDAYIKLARSLTDNEEIVEEAIRQKSGVMGAFDDMGLYPRY